ncbi:MAG: hypothetical protein ACR2PT_00395 [Endozoicomonas sp.]
MKINREAIQQATKEFFNQARALRGRLKNKSVTHADKTETQVAGKEKGSRPAGKPLSSRLISATETNPSASVKTPSIPRRREAGNNYFLNPELLKEDLKLLNPRDKKSVRRLSKNITFAESLLAREHKAKGGDTLAAQDYMYMLFQKVSYNSLDLPVVANLAEAAEKQLGDAHLSSLKDVICMRVITELAGLKGATMEDVTKMQKSSDPEQQQLATALVCRASYLASATSSRVRELTTHPETLNVITDYRRDLKKKMFNLLEKIEQQPPSVLEHPKVQKLQEIIIALKNDPSRQNDDFAVNQTMQDCVRLLRDIDQFSL